MWCHLLVRWWTLLCDVTSSRCHLLMGVRDHHWSKIYKNYSFSFQTQTYPALSNPLVSGAIPQMQYKFLWHRVEEFITVREIEMKCQCCLDQHTNTIKILKRSKKNYILRQEVIHFFHNDLITFKIWSLSNFHDHTYCAAANNSLNWHTPAIDCYVKGHSYHIR